MILLLVLASLLTLTVIAGIKRNKRAKTKVVCLVPDNCSGCMRCVKKCRYKVLYMDNIGEKPYIAVKYPDKCTACGDCVAVCKSQALELTTRGQSR